MRIYLIAIYLFFNTRFAFASSLSISSYPQTTRQSHAVVSGIANTSELKGSLWFEVKSVQQNNTIVDYGAFVLKKHWSFEARHLNSGKNIVSLYAQKKNGTKIRTSVVIYLEEAKISSIRPRPYPAEIWWGRSYHKNMEDLREVSLWSFVQKYQDALLFHANDWQKTEAVELIGHLNRLSQKNHTRWICGFHDAQPNSIWLEEVNAWSKWLETIENFGLPFSEIIYNYQVNEKLFTSISSQQSEESISTIFSDFWVKIFGIYRKKFPHIKSSHIQSPTWWSWEKYGPFIDSNDANDLLADPFSHVNMAVYIKKLTKKMQSAGLSSYTLFSEQPYYVLNWGIERQRLDNQQKILAYECWLHQKGFRHGFLCSGPNLQPTHSSAYDRHYHDESFQELVMYQAIGGRADRYVLGTTSFEEPHTIVPETNAISLTHAVAQAIHFIKGIKNMDGDLETLSLTSTCSTPSQCQVNLTNTGESVSMPAVVAFEQEEKNAHLSYFYQGQDITDVIKSPEGFVVSHLLQAKEWIRIDIIADFPMNVATQFQLSLEAYWNPQDPTGQIRSQLQLNFQNPNKLVPKQLPPRPSLKVSELSPNGIYRMISAQTAQCLATEQYSKNNGIKIIATTEDDDLRQHWNIRKHRTDSYQIINQYSNLVLEVTDASLQPKASLQQWRNWYGANQFWSIRRVSPEIFVIENTYTNQCLELFTDKEKNNHIQQNYCTNQASQQWSLELIFAP